MKYCHTRHLTECDLLQPGCLYTDIKTAAWFYLAIFRKAYITKVKDTEEGLELFKALVDAINATWDHREELVAMTAKKHAPRPLDIWTLLPQTNCKQCGEATCMALRVNCFYRNENYRMHPIASRCGFCRASRNPRSNALVGYYIELYRLSHGSDDFCHYNYFLFHI